MVDVRLEIVVRAVVWCGQGLRPPFLSMSLVPGVLHHKKLCFPGVGVNTWSGLFF